MLFGLQRLWAKLVMRKWLNISARDPEYGADDTEDESENDDVGEENDDTSSDEGFSLLLPLSLRKHHRFLIISRLTKAVKTGLTDGGELSSRAKETSKVCENAEDAIAAASAAVSAAAAAAEFISNGNAELHR